MFKRLRLVIRAKLSRLLDRVEDPGEILDYSYELQAEQVYAMRGHIADLATAKKRVARLRDRRQAQFLKLQSSARTALEFGREDLARQALERKATAQQQLQGLDTQVQQLADQQEKLIASQHQLEARIESFRAQKEVIKAQYSAAEAQVKIGEAATGIGRGMEDTGMAIQRAKDKTEELQARASAIDELTASGALEDIGDNRTQLDKELAQLSATSQVDDELAKLKAEVGPGDQAKEIEPGSKP